MTSSKILGMFRLSPFESLLKPSVCYWGSAAKRTWNGGHLRGGKAPCVSNQCARAAPAIVSGVAACRRLGVSKANTWELANGGKNADHDDNYHLRFILGGSAARGTSRGSAARPAFRSIAMPLAIRSSLWSVPRLQASAHLETAHMRVAGRRWPLVHVDTRLCMGSISSNNFTGLSSARARGLTAPTQTPTDKKVSGCGSNLGKHEGRRPNAMPHLATHLPRRRVTQGFKACRAFSSTSLRIFG